MKENSTDYSELISYEDLFSELIMFMHKNFWQIKDLSGISFSFVELIYLVDNHEDVNRIPKFYTDFFKAIAESFVVQMKDNIIDLIDEKKLDVVTCNIFAGVSDFYIKKNLYVDDWKEIKQSLQYAILDIEEEARRLKN